MLVRSAAVIVVTCGEACGAVVAPGVGVGVAVAGVPPPPDGLVEVGVGVGVGLGVVPFRSVIRPSTLLLIGLCNFR
ncbi:hypothetical protein D3C73_1537310 [compost metagenome]